jgi:hypothetical protein
MNACYPERKAQGGLANASRERVSDEKLRVTAIVSSAIIALTPVQ